jgi:CheY-like chemotaxis protein
VTPPDSGAPAPTLAVADDDEIHAELVCSWLEHLGFRVLRFSSGDDLLDWAASGEGRFDAVVLDIDMPGRDGYQSCRELRSLPRYARVPAVFVTGAGRDDLSAEIPAGQAVELIRKDDEMLDRLSRWVGRNVRTAA